MLILLPQLLLDPSDGRGHDSGMLQRVTWQDCAIQIKSFVDGDLPAHELIAWSRDAMMAEEMPPRELDNIMSLLQDISMSSPETLRKAIDHYRALSAILGN